MISAEAERHTDTLMHPSSGRHSEAHARARALADTPGDSVTPDSARSLYAALSQQAPDGATLSAARRYLYASLQDTAALDTDLPATAAGLEAWIAHNTADVGRRYQAYLVERKAGGPRRYFATRSHALHFLKAVAPTKLVDGAWLYGLMRHWNDARFSSLQRIYLEELGSGSPDKNHVVLYKKLLATNGCDKWNELPDVNFVQGTIQLALAHHADHFLPEVIGFNLGYEQLPLHLLITAYELNELGIDPYYFTLHVTVDNADTGHARTALNGMHEAWPQIDDGARFFQRVVDGYKLNMLGADTMSVIEGFDLEQELLGILADKSATGSALHSDYCRVAGRSVNDWLRDPSQVPAFVQALQETGWIKRHQDPENSRFWKLIQGERAEMFGVFSPYEQQVMHDWISGDAAAGATAASPSLSFKARQRLRENLAHRGMPSQAAGHSHAPMMPSPDAAGPSDFDLDLRQLDECLNQLDGRAATMDFLASLISPAQHHTAVGLKATRLFVRMLGC